ncbi:DUF2169 family type VI secretion system accessory protein [Burkholderia singularis]|uniref:DUF2169 family type VI secretion system accessory protein n=1 Tax=Burkholderia singularis TaxID=1503053 RepID=UPI000751F6C8|nr:pentapeptide repeat-containing protein [Burkholderia singularis]
MRHIKPQAALVTMTRTQIGSKPMLGVSIGVGFRLSDPVILVHEAAVWEALKAAAPSMPVAELAMPKRCAEWLLAGHSIHRVQPGMSGSTVDWAAWVELEGVRKTVSCRVQADKHAKHDQFVQLAIDSAQAAAGNAGQNPFGIVSGTVPLQRVSMLGVRPEPLAAMGALASDWPERKQWMPIRPDSLEAMARDGTHVGWPESVDLRFFQQAAPDQWSHRDCWTPGGGFELSGFGVRGEGYAGSLPRLAAVALVKRAGQPNPERVTLKQQTVWFLPDRDIGVMWWNGSVALDYPLDDSLEMLVAALKDMDEPVDTNALMGVASQRLDLTCTDPMQESDQVLMPAIDKGWTWELILDADDHPRFSPPQRSRAEIRSRLEHHWAGLIEAREGRARADTFRERAEREVLPSAPSDGRDWRGWFDQATQRELVQVTVRDADLTGFHFDGWRFDEVRFERCRLDRCEWRNCQLSNVHVVDCVFVEATLDAVAWKGGAIVRDQLKRCTWSNVVLEHISVEDCDFDDLVVEGGSWAAVTVQSCRGARGSVRDAVWSSVSWNSTDARYWAWTRVRSDDVNIVECKMEGLTLSQCTLAKLSVLLSDLSESVWQQSVLSFAVLSYDTSINRARLCDCVFESTCFQDLSAGFVHVDHCSFMQFNAQRLQAEYSAWTYTLLDGANMTHAWLVGGVFEHCSLKEAMLYGADLRETRMQDCNLIRAQASWTRLPGTGSWRGNLNTGKIDLPRREK